jgi:hypothetical protein
LRGRASVSVVIPTHGRPQWVVCSVESALKQSYAPLEVIVVVDGPDLETVLVLLGINDERLRLIVLDENVGGSEARNVGVHEARGEWVAFLDDDDQWVAEKLEMQMEIAERLRRKYPIISSRLLACGPDGNQTLPRRLYMGGENMADYLFCRRSFSYGDGMMQTSTLLTKRSLLLDLPFSKGLKRHQDWDWLLRVATRSDVEVVMLPEALTFMHVADQRESVSRSVDWRTSLEWAKLSHPLMSARAYAFFITTECVPRARKCGAGLGTQARLFWECIWKGQPGLLQMALFFFFCIVPEGVQKLRSKRIKAVSTNEWRECSRI